MKHYTANQRGVDTHVPLSMKHSLYREGGNGYPVTGAPLHMKRTVWTARPEQNEDYEPLDEVADAEAPYPIAD